VAQRNGAESDDTQADDGDPFARLVSSGPQRAHAQVDQVAQRDLLEIQARLTDTRGQIERLTAQEQQLQDQAAYATLNVTFGTEAVAVTEAAARWDPAAEVDRASATLLGMGQAVLSFLIVFTIVWLPLIASIAIVVGISLWVARRLGWRRPDRMPPVPPVAPPSSAEA